ncbi:MAG TPA: hypothetical protein EYG46_17695 [Myxococcales bacterium]|nr:hypothetical protein [Myxococcales bacterium]
MSSPLREVSRSKKILVLARKDKRAAATALKHLSLDEQVALVCETSLQRRSAMLELLDQPEDVIPLIPEAELCFTIKAVGITDGSWILEHATESQLVACADLDAWQGIVPNIDSMGSWLEIFAEAGEETLLRAAHSIDTELWVLYLRDRILVELKPNDNESWQPPAGGQTLDGQFYFTARRDSDDVAAIAQLLAKLFVADYWLYFRLMQGTEWEMDSDLEEWAMRWRSGRLQDLGFPTWDDAMRIYGFLRPDKRAELPTENITLDGAEFALPVWVPPLPATHDAKHAIFRAAAKLDTDERQAFFFSLITLANKVAMADGVALGDLETLPNTIEKIATLASLGLEFVATEHGIDLATAVRRANLERLFRVGANLDRTRAEDGRVSYSETLEKSIEEAESQEADRLKQQE